MRGSSPLNVATASLLLFAFIAPIANAQLSNLPDLSTATRTTARSTSSSARSTSTPSTATSRSSSGSSATTTGSSSATSTGSSTSNSIFHLTGLPTIEGASIPTLVIPFTADAPFMQKSTLPEGTVFIAVGAVLAFLGFCVVLWRGVIAWTINRSVKKAALASMMASDIKSGAGWLSNPLKPSGGFYKHAPDGSNMSLDNLTSAGKPISNSRHTKIRDNKNGPPSNSANLFFSPTASVGAGTAPMAGLSTQRGSSYLPAGYYASPSAQAGGGASNTMIGGGLAPGYQGARPRSSVGTPEPDSPGLRPQQRHSTRTGGHLQLPGQQDDNRASYVSSASRPTSMLNPSQPGLYSQASSSSLAVGTGLVDDSLPGSRAPSAYLDDLFENHGNGPRERF